MKRILMIIALLMLFACNNVTQIQFPTWEEYVAWDKQQLSEEQNVVFNMVENAAYDALCIVENVLTYDVQVLVENAIPKAFAQEMKEAQEDKWEKAGMIEHMKELGVTAEYYLENMLRTHNGEAQIQVEMFKEGAELKYVTK